MRIAVVALLLAGLLFGAREVEVSAKKLEADQNAQVAKFYGDVLFRSGDDTIRAQKAYIFFDKERKPVKFQAVGEVRFELSHGQKSYRGRCRELVYFPKKREYILIGDVYVEQLPDGKKIIAQKVLLSLSTGTLEVEGDPKKPVKLIFEIEEEGE